MIGMKLAMAALKSQTSSSELKNLSPNMSMPSFNASLGVYVHLKKMTEIIY